MRLKREMAGVDEVDFRFRQIAFERLGTGRQEYRIVLAPDRQQRRLMGAEVFLESWIEFDVRAIVVPQVQLLFERVVFFQIELIERVAVRRDQADGGNAAYMALRFVMLGSAQNART